MLIEMMTWIISHWRLSLFLLGTTLALGFAYDLGESHANEKWERELEAAREKAKASADAHSAEYETQHAKDQATLVRIREEIAREKKNPAFATCHAGPQFVRTYRSAAGY